MKSLPLVTSKSAFAAFLSLALLSPLQLVAAGERRTIHVSVNGSDTADGSPQRPFKTLARARDAVRAIPANFDGDIVVRIGGSAVLIGHPQHVHEGTARRSSTPPTGSPTPPSWWLVNPPPRGWSWLTR